MNFFKRAMLYCWRQKIRSSILFFIFTFMLSVTLIALSVGHATEKGTDEVKQTVGASIHIEIDSDNTKLYGNGSDNEWGTTYQYNGDYITKEVIDTISKVEGVVSYSAESEGGYYGSAVNFDYFPGAFNLNVSGYGQSAPYTVTLNTALSVNFLNGTYTLEEGRHIQPDDLYTVLISKELAVKNKLSVGDKITLYSMDTQQEDSFEIVGIFSGTEGLSKDAMMVDGIPANQGYIDMNSYQKMWNETNLELSSLDVYVDSADNVQEILKTIQNLPEIKEKTFIYTVDTEKFDLISTPLSSIKKMVDAAIIVISIIGAAIITLLLFLWTRGRKKEAGVLMAIGSSKLEIVLQFLTENFLIAIPAAVAALGFTSLIADKVGEYFLTRTMGDAAGLCVAIHFTDMVMICGIGAIILVVVVLLAAITVIRLKPREIFSQID